MYSGYSTTEKYVGANNEKGQLEDGGKFQTVSGSNPDQAF
jgi:hypothetical protein